MMARVLDRGRRAAEARAEAVRGELAARIAVPGVSVSVEGEHVVLTGRGLRLRALTDPALRWIGSVLR